MGLLPTLVPAVAYVQKVDPEAAKPLIERVTSGCRTFPSRPDLP